MILLTYLFEGGKGLSCQDACDSNDDGVLNIADPIALLNHLFADGGPLPAPHPGCGPDGTPDSLECEQFPPCP